MKINAIMHNINFEISAPIPIHRLYVFHDDKLNTYRKYTNSKKNIDINSKYQQTYRIFTSSLLIYIYIGPSTHPE